MQMSSAIIANNRERRIASISMAHPNTEYLVIGMLVTCKNEDQERLLASLGDIGLHGQELYRLIMDYAKDRGFINAEPLRYSDGTSLYPVNAHYDIRNTEVLSRIIDAVLCGELKEFCGKRLLRR